MTPLEFLSSVWPEQGLYCLAWRVPRQDGNGHVWRHSDRTETVAEQLPILTKLADHTDIYFCIHALRKAELWNPNKRHWRTGELGATEIRVQRNMRAARVFFFDLDVGDQAGKYASQGKALQGLRAFVEATRLPWPMIVSSGGGVHVYWRLTDELASADWRVAAQTLKNLAQHHGLLCDPARTTDTASVLRVVGTYNYKDRAHPRLVEMLRAGQVTSAADFTARLEAAAIRAELPQTPQATPIAGSPPQHNALPGNTAALEYDGVRPSVKALASACALMRAVLATKGVVPEPVWYQSLNVLRCCRGGDQIAHKWSAAGYAGYSFDETETRLHRLKTTTTAAGAHMGATSCEKLKDTTFAIVGDLCSACGYHTKGFSPIKAAVDHDYAPPPLVVQTCGDVVEQVEVPDVPAPYHRLTDGRLTVRGSDNDDDPEDITFLTHDFYPIARLEHSIERTEQHLWRAIIPLSDPKDILVDADAMYDRRKLMQVLAPQGVFPQPNHTQILADYMVAYIASLQRAAAASKQLPHMGWTSDNSGFVLQDRTLRADGSTCMSKLTSQARTAAKGVGKSGTLERQVELMRFFRDPVYIRHQFLILASLASPLLRLTIYEGAMLIAVGDSGGGKSFALHAAASFWGEPKLFVEAGLKSSTTYNALGERFNALTNLPMCLDELTMMDPLDASELAFSISQGRWKSRLKQNGDTRKTPEELRAMLALCTANASMHSKLAANHSAGDATGRRVLEIHMPRLRDLSNLQKGTAEDWLQDLQHNYGHIGEAFMSHVVAHLPDVQVELKAISRSIDQRIADATTERFWIALVATVLTAANIARRLGLIAYDIEMLERFALEAILPANRTTVEAEFADPITLLTDYIALIASDIVIISKPIGGNISNVLQKPRGKLLGHLDTETGMLWLLQRGFKDHCAATGASGSLVIDRLVDRDDLTAGVVTVPRQKFTLGRGTEHAAVQSWCFGVNTRHDSVAEQVIVDQTPGRPNKARLKVVK